MTVLALSLWSLLAIVCALGGWVGLLMLCVAWMWAASERRRPVPPRRWVCDGEVRR